jgi:hypothetical protein
MQTPMWIAALMAGALACQCGQLWAQVATTEAKPFAAGTPLGVTVEGVTTPISSNVKVFGSFINAESCVLRRGSRPDPGG